MRAWADNDRDTGYFKLLDIDVIDPCLQDLVYPVDELDSQTYYIGSTIEGYSVKLISNQAFYPPQSKCGDLAFVAELYYHEDPDDETVEPIGPITINEEESYLVFEEDGTFTVVTNDLELLGQYELRLCAYLVEHPHVETLGESILPINFSRCSLNLEHWVISDVSVPPVTESSSVFEEPLFTYTFNRDCGYFWT